MFHCFHQPTITYDFAYTKPMFLQMTPDFLRGKRIGVMQTNLIQILVFLFQGTHYIQNAVEISVRAHISTNHFIAFLSVSATFQIFGLIHPTRNQYSRFRFLNPKQFTNNSPDILNDFHIRRFRVDEYTHICVFRINAFADCFAR